MKKGSKGNRCDVGCAQSEIANCQLGEDKEYSTFLGIAKFHTTVMVSDKLRPVSIEEVFSSSILRHNSSCTSVVESYLVML